jgi:hypothetical protein
MVTKRLANSAVPEATTIFLMRRRLLTTTSGHWHYIRGLRFVRRCVCDAKSALKALGQFPHFGIVAIHPLEQFDISQTPQESLFHGSAPSGSFWSPTMLDNPSAAAVVISTNLGSVVYVSPSKPRGSSSVRYPSPSCGAQGLLLHSPNG